MLELIPTTKKAWPSLLAHVLWLYGKPGIVQASLGPTRRVYIGRQHRCRRQNISGIHTYTVIIKINLIKLESIELYKKLAILRNSRGGGKTVHVVF